MASFETYTLTTPELEAFASEVMGIVAESLAKDGMFGEDKLEAWVEAHTIVVRKTGWLNSILAKRLGQENRCIAVAKLANISVKMAIKGDV